MTIFRDFKYTIILAIIILFVIFGLISFAKQANECEDEGGEYMRKYNGVYTCAKELKDD